MIVRALVRLATLAALAVAGFKIARALRARRPGAGAPMAQRGRMVRDRVCNTFLPVERALRLDVGGSTHFFCSEACRGRFLRPTEKAESA